jgi:hypothetical protein
MTWLAQKKRPLVKRGCRFESPKESRDLSKGSGFSNDQFVTENRDIWDLR